MGDLQTKAREFYLRGGYRVIRDIAGVLIVEAADDGSSGGAGRANDVPKRVAIFIDEKTYPAVDGANRAASEERSEREARWLSLMEREIGQASPAASYFLVPSTAGWSQSFNSRSKDLLGRDGGRRVPVFFFDTDYKIDDKKGKRARNVVASILTQSTLRPRVPQPFSIRTSLESVGQRPGSGDIVPYAIAALTDPSPRPRMVIFDGSAGGGKSVAFEEVARALFSQFMENKQAQRPGQRPIMFLPHHLRPRDGNIGYVDDLIAAVNDTDMANVAHPDQIKWLLLEGFSVWMFDGLDEIYDGDPAFLPTLEAALTAPGSKARLLLCTRDSLLTSSGKLRQFVERSMGAGTLEVLELSAWDEEGWRRLARLKSNGVGKAEAFAASVKSSPVAANLAKLPFYCDLLWSSFEKTGSLPKDEFQLLTSIFERMMQREYDKSIFRWQDFVDTDLLSDAIEEEIERLGGPIAAAEQDRVAFQKLLDEAGRENVIELIEGLAHLYRRTPGPGTAGASLGADDIRDFFGGTYLSSSLDGDTERRRLTVLVQFAFFGGGRRAGSVDFAHPIMADYLAGRYAMSLLQDGFKDAGLAPGSGLRDAVRPASAARQAIGTAPYEADGLFFKYLHGEVSKDASLRDGLKALVKTVDVGRDNVKAFVASL